MPKHYSTSLWVFVVLQGIKLAKKSQNYRKLTPNNRSYQDIEYSGGLKTFIMVMNDYKWLEPACESINPVVVVYLESFRA